MIVPVQVFPIQYSGMYLGTIFMLLFATLVIWNVVTIGSFRNFIRTREIIYTKRIELMENIIKDDIRQILTILKK